MNTPGEHSRDRCELHGASHLILPGWAPMGLEVSTRTVLVSFIGGMG